MADDHVPEAEGSSNAPELASPQLSIPLSDKSSERQRTDELLESSPPITSSATPMITIIVGPEEKVFEVPEYIVKMIPCFTSIFQKRTFREAAEGQLTLPEDDPLVFDRLLQFLHTGDYLPRIVPALDPCETEQINSLFQYREQLEFRNLHDCKRRYDASRCGSLEWTLEVIVDVRKDIKAPYRHSDPQFGRWKTADATHELFEREVLLFCMAERFLMDDLKELCLTKMHMFPLGPRELAVLAEHVPAKVYGPTDNPRIGNKLHELLLQCIHYHQRYFDEWRSGGSFWNLSENTCDYADYLRVIESQMTGHGAMLFHAMAGARHSIERSVGSTHAGWECHYERIGVCQADCTERIARNDFGRRASWACEDQETEAAPDAHDPNGCYPGFEFCEAHAGDTIVHLTLNQPRKGLVYGLNVRADRWSWYPRSLLRFFETRSYRDCSCCGCQPPTFKVDGRGPRLYLHDPEGKGLAYRPGTRQQDLEKERKEREG